MRLREVKRKIEELGSNGEISISLKQQLGSFYIIADSSKLFHLLLFLSRQEWNNLDFSGIQEIIDNTEALKNAEVMLDSNQYNKLVGYVNEVNRRLPIFFGMVSALSKEQGEFDINIKLSEKIQTVDDLDGLVSEIKGLEKFVILDGKKLDFVGFDVGSWWIALSAGCGAVYGFVMACVKLAQEVLKTQEQYHKTKEAKIHYRMTLKEESKYTEEGLKKYCREYCKKYLDEGAAEIASKLGDYNGSSESEIREKAKNAAEKLVNIIGNGNEVHISLNSSSAVKETADGKISVNYEELRKLASDREQEDENGKKLAAPNDNQSETDSNL